MNPQPLKIYKSSKQKLDYNKNYYHMVTKKREQLDNQYNAELARINADSDRVIKELTEAMHTEILNKQHRIMELRRKYGNTQNIIRFAN